MDAVLRVLNLKQSTKIDKTPDQIPNLVSQEVLNKWQDGDTDPYYKIQKIDFPIKANGFNYQKTFFETYISKLKDRPIPGAKSGHEMMWGKRAPTDFIVIGGLIEGNEKSGSVYLKNYIPPKGESGDNEVFIRENKSDMIHYSIVAYVTEEVIENDDGTVINIIESRYGERNDAVEWGTGAMQQVTNQNDLNNSQNADNEDKSSNKESILNKEELIKSLKTSKANAVTLSEVAKVLGAEDQLITDEHTAGLKLLNGFNELKVEDPLKEFKAMQEQLRVNADTVRSAELDKAFGALDEGKNVLRQYAEKQTEGKTGQELVNTIEELKKDPVAMALSREQADYTSDFNVIGKVDNKEDKKAKNEDVNTAEYVKL